jgi:hypothetical protein
MQDDGNHVSKRTPWNKDKLIGPNPPLRPKHVWSIRTRLQVEGGGVQSGQRGANDHDSLGAAHLLSPRTAAPISPASSVIARTGQADAARRTWRR